MERKITEILRFLGLAERLKFELRHSWLSNGDRESVAEHSWQMALLALLLHRHLEHPVDLERSLKMALIHDLVEAEAGDVPFFEKGDRREAKTKRERAAIERIRGMLAAESVGEELHQLWCEFEEGETGDARFVRALDHLEVQIQHNLAPLSTWEPVEYGLVFTKMDRYCDHDRFLQAICDAVKRQAEEKMRSGGIDVEAVKRGAASHEVS